MTDWGAHMFDIAQWALGKDGSGPVEIIPPGYSYYEHLTYKYDNGVIVSEEPFDGTTPGVQIYGEDGWIKVSRGKFEASKPEWEMKVADSDVPYETKVGHHRAFIEAVLSRNDPNVPVEVGHSSFGTRLSRRSCMIPKRRNCFIIRIVQVTNMPSTYKSWTEEFS